MKVGDKFLVVRFGTNIIENCIERHQEVIESKGFCWFGKIGVVPSQKVLKALMDQETPSMLLYTRNHAYECKLLECNTDKPSSGYPHYYEDELFESGMEPKSYYKLASIEEVPISELDNYIVVSSRNRLMTTLNKSMSSYFYAEYPNPDEKISETQKIKKQRLIKKEQLSENDCRYRKDGRCGLKGCVNYQYECDRPNMCIKQKR